jgi:Ankyrin repeats (3 copies)
MSSVPIQGNHDLTANQFAGQPQLRPNPMHVQMAPPPPRIANVESPVDPRATKRPREDDLAESDEPVIKRARTATDITACDANQRALLTAITAGDVVQTGKLLRQLPHLRDAHLPGEIGLTPLCLAAHNGNLDIVALLLRCGAPLDAMAKNGSTPLMFAAENGHADVVRKLCLLGATVDLVSPITAASALFYATENMQFEACKQLITMGAHFDLIVSFSDRNGGSIRNTPLSISIRNDFSDLIGWMIDTGKIHVNSVEPASNFQLLNLAVRFGSLGLIRLLIERGACVNKVTPFPGKNWGFRNVWDVASFFLRADSAERLIGLGLIPPLKIASNPEKGASFEYWALIDVINHLSIKEDAKVPADKLGNEIQRACPWISIESLATNIARVRNHSLASAIRHFRSLGWLAAHVAHAGELKNLSIGANLLGSRIAKLEPQSSEKTLTSAQVKQRLIEHLSFVLCAGEYAQPFAGLNLTAQGERRMNQIAEAQKLLLLKGIAYLREQFQQQVATLPSMSMNTYISRAHTLNEPDMYRKLTKEWGLYDPIARTVLRLVQESYHTLRSLRPEKTTAEFAALPPDEQLKYVIVDKLEEWDKIPEIIETLIKLENPEELDIVSELLFQQWRLFCEAFGVTKLRFSQFGPHRPAQPEPVMEVDDAPREVLGASSGEVSLHSQ